MIKEAQKAKEVRNIKFHVKIEDADILGEAINEIVSKRTSGKIDVSGRGFKVPDMSEFSSTIYSSTIILADQGDAPKGEYIFTMENVTFRTEIQVGGKEKGYSASEIDLQLHGGWVLKDGEYVLVIFTQDKATEMSDLQKLQGRLFYNAVFTRYITHAIGEDVLELRNFSVRIPDNDYPDVKNTYNDSKKVTDYLRGGKTGAGGGGTNWDEEAGVKQKKKTTKDDVPDFVKNNFYLYDPKQADIMFGYRDPASKTPFNKASDPGILFHFNFPNFATAEREVHTEGEMAGTSYNKQGSNSNPGDVEVMFSNIPKNMPAEIFKEMYDYLKNGLGGKELNAGTNLTYGNTVFTQDPSQGEQSLFERNKQKIKQLTAEIEQLYRDNEDYKVDFDENLPSPYQARGVAKNILKYLNELEAYVNRLKQNLPLSLKELDRLIEEKGEAAVNPKNVNLLKILKTKQ